jgi:hypothetical protein
MIKRLGLLLALCAATGCGGGGSSSAPAAQAPVISPTAQPSTIAATPSPSPTATAGAASLPGLPLALDVNNLPGQFYGQIVGTFSAASPRELVMLPNGDLLVGTGGGTAAFEQSGKIYIIANAESATPAAPSVFATLSDIGCSQSAGTNTNGITFAPGTGGGTIFVGMECSVWKIPYVTGDHTASSPATQFLAVRTGSPPNPAPDSDVHHTTSVLATNNSLYISVGSDCNACIETDATRAAIFKTSISSPVATTVATRVRNALALAVNPATNTVWAGGAGQDCMVGATCFSAQDPTYALNGHPYEWMDPLTTHAAPADYMWPWCEENNIAVTAPEPNLGSAPTGTNCASMIVAPVRAPAYAHGRDVLCAAVRRDLRVSVVVQRRHVHHTARLVARKFERRPSRGAGSCVRADVGKRRAHLCDELVDRRLAVFELGPQRVGQSGAVHERLPANGNAHRASRRPRCRPQRQLVHQRRQRRRDLPHSARHGTAEREPRRYKLELDVATMTSRRLARP